MANSPLILPGNPLFDATLATAIPPNWREVAEQAQAQPAYVACAGSGLLRPASPEELVEYLEGGEFDEREEELEEMDYGELVYYGPVDA